MFALSLLRAKRDSFYHLSLNLNIMKLLNRTFGVLSVLILTIGLTQLFNQTLFLFCFGLGLLSTVFYLLTAYLNNKYNGL